MKILCTPNNLDERVDNEIISTICYTQKLLSDTRPIQTTHIYIIMTCNIKTLSALQALCKENPSEAREQIVKNTVDDLSCNDVHVTSL